MAKIDWSLYVSWYPYLSYDLYCGDYDNFTWWLEQINSQPSVDSVCSYLVNLPQIHIEGPYPSYPFLSLIENYHLRFANIIRNRAMLEDFVLEAIKKVLENTPLKALLGIDETCSDKDIETLIAGTSLDIYLELIGLDSTNNLAHPILLAIERDIREFQERHKISRKALEQIENKYCFSIVDVLQES